MLYIVTFSGGVYIMFSLFYVCVYLYKHEIFPLVSNTRAQSAHFIKKEYSVFTFENNNSSTLAHQASSVCMICVRVCMLACVAFQNR